jgi:hypothetical protein
VGFQIGQAFWRKGRHGWFMDGCANTRSRVLSVALEEAESLGRHYIAAEGIAEDQGP